MKRPLLVGLIFVFGWEPLAMALPGYLKQFTVAYYLQGLVPHAMPTDSPLSLVQDDLPRLADALESLIWLAVIEVALPLAGCADVTRREYVLEQ